MRDLNNCKANAGGQRRQCSQKEQTLLCEIHHQTKKQLNEKYSLQHQVLIPKVYTQTTSNYGSELTKLRKSLKELRTRRWFNSSQIRFAGIDFIPTHFQYKWMISVVRQTLRLLDGGTARWDTCALINEKGSKSSSQDLLLLTLNMVRWNESSEIAVSSLITTKETGKWALARAGTELMVQILDVSVASCFRAFEISWWLFLSSI